MRPINLIPPDDQAGRMQARAGALSYVVLGVLAAILLAVTLTVLTSNRISDAKSEVTALEQERDAAQARAESLSAFAEFRSMQEQRTATVVSLAQSRFDWERVLREFALVLPEDVWLIELEGTVSSEVTLTDGADIGIRDGVAGPALEIIGCAASQDAVGAFVAALRDIDGVTRATVAKSERPELSESSGTEGSEDASGDDDCRTEDFITRFEIVAAFDGVPVAAAAPESADPAAPAAPTTEPTAEEGVTETPAATETAPGG